MPLRSKNQSDISITRKLCYTWHSKIRRHIIMIAYIAGALVSAGENYIVIDNHGSSYPVSSLSAFRHMERRLKYTHICI